MTDAGARGAWLQHPLITQLERTGYPTAPYADRPPLCARCGQTIAPFTLYGQYDGRAVCEDCIDDEWRALTAREKYEALGFDAKFDG